MGQSSVVVGRRCVGVSHALCIAHVALERVVLVDVGPHDLENIGRELGERPSEFLLGRIFDSLRSRRICLHSVSGNDLRPLRLHLHAQQTQLLFVLQNDNVEAKNAK
jgi:hypothetical protein